MTHTCGVVNFAPLLPTSLPLVVSGEGYFLLLLRLPLKRLQHRIRLRVNPQFHQKLGKLRVVAGSLTTYRFATVLLAVAIAIFTIRFTPSLRSSNK